MFLRRHSQSSNSTGQVYHVRCSCFSKPNLSISDTFFVEYKGETYFWKDIRNCRALFDAYAKEKGFDPLNEEGWYQIELADLDKWRVSTHLKRN